MKNDKKELIFSAMEELIWEMPCSEISVEAIAKRAGIGKGSIYYYFDSKEEILSSVIERSYRRAVYEYYNSVTARPGTSAIERIKLLFQSVIKKEFGASEKNILHILTQNEDLMLHHLMNCIAVREIAPVLASLLKEGIAEGTITTDTPDESAEMIVAVLTFFLDDGIFPSSSASKMRVRRYNKMKILAKVLDSSMQTKKGSFDFLFSMNTDL